MIDQGISFEISYCRIKENVRSKWLQAVFSAIEVKQIKSCCRDSYVSIIHCQQLLWRNIVDNFLVFFKLCTNIIIVNTKSTLEYKSQFISFHLFFCTLLLALYLSVFYFQPLLNLLQPFKAIQTYSSQEISLVQNRVLFGVT